MRGFGAVQTCFAAEAQMDKLAQALRIDPVELRLLNALGPGGTLPTGQPITGSLPVAEVIRRCAALQEPEAEELPRAAIRLPGGAGNTTRGEGVKRGVGFAVGFKNLAYSEGFDDSCAARVRLFEDGSAEVHEAGGAALAEQAARGGGDVDVERVYRQPLTAPLDPETGQVGEVPAHVAFACAAMKVVAEVDVELGLTRVVWIGTAQDVGKAVNPQAVEGQIDGGTAQGLGLALMEEIQTRDGLILNPNFTDYLIPTALDMPPVVSELVEDPEPGAPYGVKGVGEPPTVVSTAAIVSALRNATGRGLTRVPVRPDDIVGL